MTTDADTGSSRQVYGFTGRLINAMPRWAVGCLSVVLGCVLTVVVAIQFLGVSSQFHRMVDAYVVRFEKSANSIDEATKSLEKLVARVEATEKQTASLTERVAKMENSAALMSIPPTVPPPALKPKAKVIQAKPKSAVFFGLLQ